MSAFPFDEDFVPETPAVWSDSPVDEDFVGESVALSAAMDYNDHNSEEDIPPLLKPTDSIESWKENHFVHLAPLQHMPVEEDLIVSHASGDAVSIGAPHVNVSIACLGLNKRHENPTLADTELPPFIPMEYPISTSVIDMPAGLQTRSISPSGISSTTYIRHSTEGSGGDVIRDVKRRRLGTSSEHENMIPC